MKIAVYYVIRVYNDGSFNIDSGPHKSYHDAVDMRNENHYYSPHTYEIFETYITGKIL